jgi:hypothetical protein
MTVIQPPGVQWMVNLLQLKLGYSCDIFTPVVQSDERNFLLDDRSGVSSTYDMIIIKGRDLHDELIIIMTLNEQTAIWYIDAIPMKEKDTADYHQQRPD